MKRFRLVLSVVACALVACDGPTPVIPPPPVEVVSLKGTYHLQSVNDTALPRRIGSDSVLQGLLTIPSLQLFEYVKIVSVSAGIVRLDEVEGAVTSRTDSTFVFRSAIGDVLYEGFFDEGGLILKGQGTVLRFSRKP